MARLGIPQVSTGDLLRSAVARGTELGRRAKSAMDSGGLVDDATVVGIIRERLGQADAARGYVLDGFPRNRAQAQALANMLGAIGQPLDAVVLFEVDYAEIARRIAGRRSCPNCGTVYNVHDAATPNITHCRQCAAAPELVQRPDDNEQTVTRRLQVYDEQTRPLIEHYRAQGLLRSINAMGSVDDVEARLIAALPPVPVPVAARPRPKTKPKAKRRARPIPKAKAKPKLKAKSMPKRKAKAKAKARSAPKRKVTRRPARRPARRRR